MSDKENLVECEAHGETEATFVCQHLVGGEKLGFNLGYDPDRPDDLWPDAWCNHCEEAFLEEGEWNEQSEKIASIKLICTSCYENTRARNWLEDENVLHELIISGNKFLNERQESFAKQFKADEHERWDWYQETGKLVFSHDDKPQVEADIHFVGSYSSSSETWMWAWANEYLDEKIKSASRALKAIGEQQKLLKLTSARWEATEVDGWEMTALLAKEMNSIGAYRTPSENGFVYMVVEKARWINKKKLFGLF